MDEILGLPSLFSLIRSELNKEHKCYILFLTYDTYITLK